MDGSSLTRQRVASKLFYQNDSQRTDILDPNKTQTELIAGLAHMQALGYHIEVTALRTDHHDDSDIGTPPRYFGTHAHGWGIDFWPLNTAKAGDYMNQNSHPFRQFLKDLAAAPFRKQIGLGGCADNSADECAAGSSWFPDSAEDHLHFGVEA